MVQISERQRLIIDLQRAIVAVAQLPGIHLPLPSTSSPRRDILLLLALKEYDAALLRMTKGKFQQMFSLLQSLFRNSTLTWLCDTLKLVLSTRYLSRQVLVVPKNGSPYKFLCRLDDKRFRQETRMTQSSFHQLVCLIKNHQTFKNNSHKAQAMVEDQLVVFLSKLGRYGNGASVGILARYFGISEGSVCIYCKRCLEAILSLEKMVVSWPNAEERRRIRSRISAKNSFHGCVGFVDGTLFPVYAKPSISGEDFFCRKGFYGMSGMIVCDDNMRIRFMDLGWPASVHDSRVYRNSELHQNSHFYFSKYEYLLADSGYFVCQEVMPSFKKTRGTELHATQKDFNTRVAKCRCVNEHCIGLLKCRFQSLRGMRLDISLPRDAMMMTRMIRAAAILHNLLLSSRYDAVESTDLQDCDETESDASAGLAEVCSLDETDLFDMRAYHINLFQVEQTEC